MDTLAIAMEWTQRLQRAARYWQNRLGCNHSRTPATEGKCFCPDCGQGIIYHWVVLRCGDCGVRRDSAYFLRKVVPADRCCTHCGTEAVRLETLETPAFYQLRKARLVAQTEAEYLKTRFSGFHSVNARTAETPLGSPFLRTVRTWCNPQPPQPAYALAPI